MEPLEIDLERTVAQILVTTAAARRRQIARKLVEISGSRCLAGPFRGMILPEASSWGDGDLAPKLLGCYESELHAALERALARAPDLVVDVGCAEGYYAVGAALRLPGRPVHAFDVDEKARAVCGEAALRNGVADRVRIERLCDAPRLTALLGEQPKALVVLDCEGFERSLVTTETLPALRRADLVIECHDFVEAGLTERLAALLAQSHDVEILREGPRDPAASPVLQRLGSLDRWIAVCEFRPTVMRWIVAWARPG